MSRHKKPRAPVAPPTEEEIAAMFASTKGDQPSGEVRVRPLCPGCGRPVTRYCGAHCFGDHDYDEGSVWHELGNPSNFGDD